jgi:hypothetical protein
VLLLKKLELLLYIIIPSLLILLSGEDVVVDDGLDVEVEVILLIE